MAPNLKENNFYPKFVSRMRRLAIQRENNLSDQDDS